MTQEQFRRIIRRFKDYQTSYHVSNKENLYKTQLTCRNPNISKEQNSRIHNKNVQNLEAIIQSIMTDATKMFCYYEEVIYESRSQLDALKEEFSSFRQSAAEQKRQIEAVVSDLSAKIQMLNNELIDRQQVYNELVERYQMLQQKASELHNQDKEIFKQIHLQFRRSQFQKQHILHDVIRQKDELKTRLLNSVKFSAQLQDQNHLLKNVNQQLVQNVQFLKSKFQEDKIIEYESQNGYYDQLQKCGVETISSRDERSFLLQQQDIMDSTEEINLSREKEVLNISEHYSKFNRTEEFQSKGKSNYDLVDLQEGVVRNSILQQTGRPRFFIIDTNHSISKSKSKGDTMDKQPYNSRNITEIREFKVQEPPSNAINVYQAFFSLLTQCEKLNSPHFKKISQIDLNPLYPKLLSDCVPFNKWQQQIRKVLQSNVC